LFAFSQPFLKLIHLEIIKKSDSSHSYAHLLCFVGITILRPTLQHSHVTRTSLTLLPASLFFIPKTFHSFSSSFPDIFPGPQ
jgi:hypothetical protein